ncbi:hypothetical protein [Catellatospora sichuanensis]|uniref:hypothetical protein n=1 Tax=Catellatospora sichuanensis TaxID=1969805 RepID=UPI0011829815|nr:hypothetical protein [Catellatospora sichuanensis]
MPSPLKPLTDGLYQAMQSGDIEGFWAHLGRVSEHARPLPPDELTTVVEDLAALLPKLSGDFARVAVLAGACVEWGGSPLPLAEVLPAQAAKSMLAADVFRVLWNRVTWTGKLPDRENPPPMAKVIDKLVRRSRRLGLSEEEATIIAMAWYDVDYWCKALITTMALPEFRRAMSDRDKVRETAAEIAGDVPLAHWVHGLAEVLDDEPLIVLDHATGRGFRLTMSGLGDNFQLHTLLADRLVGPTRRGLPHFEPVPPDWVDAATTGEPNLSAGNMVVRRFRLFDGTGAYVSPESRPADIATTDGMRILVMHPPNGMYGWLNGRVYEHLVPTMTFDHELPPDEAARWLSRVIEARQTDLMAN